MNQTRNPVIELVSAREPADQAKRKLGLDIGQSFVVRAPAGSGKTELLVRRFLRLLAVVDEPEQLLAITFTRKAAAEMRKRVLDALVGASNPATNLSEKDEKLRADALAALKHAETRGWELLRQTNRLRIETLDALSLAIAHGAPLVSRLAPDISPVDDASSLFQAGASATLRILGEDSEDASALAAVLEAGDAKVPELRAKLASMLEQRAFWMPLLDELDNPEALRLRLETSLARSVSAACESAAEALRAITPAMRTELLALGRFAAESATDAGICACASLKAWPEADEKSLAQWRALCALLLTVSGSLRKSLRRNHGFEDGPERNRLLALLNELREMAGVEAALGIIRELPEPKYAGQQWQALLATLRVLRRSVEQLGHVFTSTARMDFSEATIAARRVLLSTSRPLPPRHILVDEYQDTSVPQHELLKLFIRAWDPAEGSTLFVVGDPMQSIYGFRRAEVRLFDVAREPWQEGLHPELIELSVNFRSRTTLVEHANRLFPEIFSAAKQKEVPFTAAEAWREGGEAVPIVWHAAVLEEDGRDDEREAKKLCAEIERIQNDEPKATIAILLRVSTHGQALLSLLRSRGIPYQAMELEKLNERQEVLDMLSLAAALRHPADRIAWLSVLRAPWCGLTRRSLETLCGFTLLKWKPMPCMVDLLAERAGTLPPGEQQRALRAHGILSQATAQSGREVFSRLLDRTWRALGGPATLDTEQLINVTTFMQMLERREAEDLPLDAESLHGAAETLFASPDPQADGRLQVMTIHKSKGLEFDYVFVPQMHRQAAKDTSALLNWLSAANFTSPQELLLAPCPPDGEKDDPLTAWIKDQRAGRADAELRRLLYVAVTRAREAVHLSGGACLKKSGDIQAPDSSSLLRLAWGSVDGLFADALAARNAANREASAAAVAFPRGSAKANGDISIAAAAVVLFPGGAQEKIRRLPLEMQTVPPASIQPRPVAARSWNVGPRHEASPLTRAAGTIAHTLLEQLPAALAAGQESVWIASTERRAAALLRQKGFAADVSAREARKVQGWLRTSATSENGRWIFGPHSDAESELSLTVRDWDGTTRGVRLDRTFLAGQKPLSTGEDARWIVDYKTASGEKDLDAFLDEQRSIYQETLLGYREALSGLRNDGKPVRLALYFPAADRILEITDGIA